MIADNNDPFANKDLNLHNPHGKMTCLILNLYTMELGMPPLYAEVNRVCRNMDLTQLTNLGPFIRALNQVTDDAE